MKAPKESAKQASQSTVRLKSQMTFRHDLFCLETSEMKRNMAWSKKMKAIIEVFDHKHMFHTFDSDGRRQANCTPALGHFHQMNIVKRGANGDVDSYEAGPAVRYVLERDEDTNEYKKVIRPVDKVEAHTHEVEYRVSEEMQTRKYNETALLAQSQFLAKETGGLTPEEQRAIKSTEREKTAKNSEV